MNQFKSGDEVYTAGGVKCRFVGYFDEGVLVIPFLAQDDEYDKQFGDPLFVKGVFVIPPLEEKHAEIAALDAEITEKKKQAGKLHWEIESAKREHEELCATLKENEVLKRIEDYLRGRFAYFVILRLNDVPSILPAEKALEENENVWGHRLRDKGIKLLTLFGNDNDRFRNGRGLEWRINQYSDGSGYDTEVFPVESEDEGKTMIQRLYDAEVENWRNTENKHCHRALTWAKCDHLVAPEDVREFLKQNRIRVALDKVDEARRKLNQAELELEKVQA